MWIAEGLLIYLPEDAVDLLLSRIGARSAAGSRMGLTLGSRGVIERFGADAVPGSAASMWVSEMPDDPVGWLAGHGWEARTSTLRECAAAYGRPIGTPPQREERAVVRKGQVVARNDALRFSGASSVRNASVAYACGCCL